MPTRSAADCVQLPCAGNSLEGELSSTLELQWGAGNEIHDRSRHQHLASLGLGRHASPDVHGDPADVVAAKLDFAGVNADPNFETQRIERTVKTAPALHGASRAVKRGEDTVAGRLDQAATVPLDLVPYHQIALVEELPPLAVTDGCGLLCGAHDVGEHDGRQHPVRRCERASSGDEGLDLIGKAIGVENDVLARDLDEAGTLDVVGEPPPVCDRDGPVVGGVDHERRR